MFRVHGARGSAPTSGSHVARFGGHTTCYSVDAGSDGVVVVDAGTGIAFGRGLEDAGTYHLFFTHFHLDHVQGLPFFTPIYDPEAEFVFYGVPPPGLTLEEVLAGVFQPPWFPVDFRETASRKSFVDARSADLSVGGLAIATTRLLHPQGCIGYRFDRGGASLVVATDHEAGNDAYDAPLCELADGADVLLHDGQYTEDEYAAKVGWGHSTWKSAGDAADRAQVGTLVLTSHDPRHGDDVIEEMVRMTSEVFGDVRAARPNLQFDL